MLGGFVFVSVFFFSVSHLFLFLVIFLFWAPIIPTRYWMFLGKNGFILIVFFQFHLINFYLLSMS